MDDTRHVFNVIFKTENQEITNRHLFQVYPIYWTTIIIPAHAYIQGIIQVSPCGHNITTGSVVFGMTLSNSAVPRMNYSGCTTASSITIFSASGVENTYDSYVS